MFSAHDSLACLPRLSTKDVELLAAAGFNTAAQLVAHFPKRYEDRRRFDAFPNQPTSHAVCLRGTVTDASLKRFGPNRRLYEALIMDGSGGVFGSGNINT